LNWRLHALLSLQARVGTGKALRLNAGGDWAFYRHGLTVWEPRVDLAFLF